MIGLALNVVAFLFLAAVALTVLRLIVAFLMALYLAVKKMRLQKGWQPQVGDVVIFESMAGPIRKLVVDVDEQNPFNLCLYSRTANSSGTGWYMGGVTFTGERGVKREGFWS